MNVSVCSAASWGGQTVYSASSPSTLIVETYVWAGQVRKDMNRNITLDDASEAVVDVEVSRVDLAQFKASQTLLLKRLLIAKLDKVRREQRKAGCQEVLVLDEDQPCQPDK